MKLSVVRRQTNFAVAFAGVAQNYLKEMRPFLFTIHHHPRALTKIDLRLGSRVKKRERKPETSVPNRF
jgi:hypothetical protein